MPYLRSDAMAHKILTVRFNKINERFRLLIEELPEITFEGDSIQQLELLLAEAIKKLKSKKQLPRIVYFTLIYQISDLPARLSGK